MTHLRYMLIAVACVGISLGVVFAEDALSSGTLRGHITDVTPAQNPIEGVEVKIVAQDGDKEFTTKTDADGNYKRAGLPAGRYRISISKAGYEDRVGQRVSIVEGGDHFVPLKMSQKGDIEPFFQVQRDKRLNILVKQRVVSVIQRFAEGVGKRYVLDETAINAFHQSILNSVGSALEEDGGLSIFARAVEGGNMSLLEVLLSHPGCKTAFAEHLSEAQLQDYLEFTAARRQRDRQAIIHRITVALDKELSLRADQREQVVQSLLNAADNELFPTSMNATHLNSQQLAQLAHYRLKVSLDDLLSEVQSKVWHGLINSIVPKRFVDIRADVFEKEKGGVDIVIDEIDIQEIPPRNPYLKRIRASSLKPS